MAFTLLLALQDSTLDAAVRRAVEAIRSAKLEEHVEIRLWTLVDVGVPSADPLVNALLYDVLSKPVESTKSAALQAMILNILNPAEFRVRIALCAQFLIDNQAKDGRWGAGTAVDPPTLPPEERRPIVANLRLVRRKDGPEPGDAVHARWAALGLRACRRAGMLAPDDVAVRAEAAWRKETADAADLVSGLCIHLDLQNKPWASDPDVLQAMGKLRSPERPVDPQSLDALKRAMRHVESGIPGDQAWCSAGFKILRESQKTDGSWGGIEDTCAAARYLHSVRYTCPPVKKDR